MHLERMERPDSTATLIIKHLPAELSLQEREELLLHFGALKVHPMSDAGRMKRTAFATFPSHKYAAAALERLHQLQVLGSVLSAEFAHPSQARHFPLVSDLKSFKIQEKGEEGENAEKKDSLDLTQRLTDFAQQLHEIGPDLGLNYFPSPLLKYSYPEPSPTILNNICNALASVPKFYTQVLHLMNKMNLPPPFGPPTPAPPLHPDPPVEEEPPPSTSESELESDTEEQPASLKRPAPVKVLQQPAKKKIRLHPIPVPPPPTVPTPKVAPSGDQPQPKKINIIAPSGTLEATSDAGIEIKEGGFGTIAPPTVKEPEASIENPQEAELPCDFISLEEIAKNKLNPSDMKHLSAFRNYSPGTPSTRLYIKNLSKHVTEKDLYRIFGQFIKQDSDVEKQMFNVVLMKEGRMKGQAFITLAHQDQAQQAVDVVNGFKLYDKPIVVQFARSQKKD